MLNITDREKCCGCGACVQACPQKCLDLIEDREGFYYPKLNEKYCINCNVCTKVCPIINAGLKVERVRASYVSYAKDVTIRMKSSSGGIFTLIAEEIINKNGVVVGVAMDNNHIPQHILINRIEDLEKLRGSKYVQSNIGDTYRKTKEKLKEGKVVLFTGTACQISGLKSFLNREYKNLYTIDVLCHGVPSIKLWKKYLLEKKQELGEELQQAYFRKKTTGWKNYSIEFKTTSKVYSHQHVKDPFMKMFLKNISLRPSCYNCKFKALERDSDLSLGDCWTINNFMPELNDDKGISVVLVHSEKGERMIESISDRVVSKKVYVEDALPVQMDSRRSVTMHPLRTTFFDMLNNDATIKELSKLVEDPLSVKIKKTLSKIKHYVKKFIKYWR